MTRRPALVVFLGGLRGSPVEDMVAAARRAAALDSIEAARSSGAVDRAILATDEATGLQDVPWLEIDRDAGPFQFGARLAQVIRRHSLERVVYIGGGSVPLLGAGFAGVVSALSDNDVAVTNNAFSSDLVAFPVSAAVLAAVEPVERDNGLARALEAAGLALEELPRTVETQMDIDEPADLAVLVLTRQGGARLQAYLQTLTLDLARYERVLPLFLDRQAQILVAGRVGSHAWRYLERETACRVRLFAEERGLEADARGRAGDARSLLGFFIEESGIERFFEVLAELADAAFIDTRVVLAHMRIEASRQDRFRSDLGAWNEVREPFLREFTRAACQSRIPVLMGGHSLMSGALMALNEFAWQQHELRHTD